MAARELGMTCDAGRHTGGRGARAAEPDAGNEHGRSQRVCDVEVAIEAAPVDLEQRFSFVVPVHGVAPVSVNVAVVDAGQVDGPLSVTTTAPLRVRKEEVLRLRLP